MITCKAMVYGLQDIGGEGYGVFRIRLYENQVCKAWRFEFIPVEWNASDIREHLCNKYDASEVYIQGNLLIFWPGVG